MFKILEEVVEDIPFAAAAAAAAEGYSEGGRKMRRADLYRVITPVHQFFNPGSTSILLDLLRAEQIETSGRT